MFLLAGVLGALYERQSSGRGQIVDAAMTDGVAALSAMAWDLRASGLLAGGRGRNMLDGGAPQYGTYRCADGKYLALGALEERFYRELLTRLGMEGDVVLSDRSHGQWKTLRQRLEEIFATRSRDEWCELLAGTDACVSPVLDWEEAALHPHNVSRGTFVEVQGVTQPAPAPRFSRTPSALKLS